MKIEEEIRINAPLAVVWRIFSKMEDWDSWNTACRSCCILEGDGDPAPGTCFSFVIKPLGFPIKVAPRIVTCEPAREVIWEGGRLGINARHLWLFREEQSAVVVTSIEKFEGPLVWIGYMLQVPKKLHRLTVQFLQNLKSAAEACSA